MDRKKLIKKGKSIAKILKCDFTEKAPDNSYGGYGDGGTTIWLNTKGELIIVSTCDNCGDGGWIVLPELES